jgi:hypothetical protein
MSNARELSQVPNITEGFKNRIINGDMRIDQRNAGASVTPSTGTYTLDRWQGFSSQASKFTVQQNAGSVTPPAGFTNYLGCTSSSAYTVGASEVFMVRQFIEGFNVADLGFGTANAKTVTLSFWVRSSLTGTFGGALQNDNALSNRSYPFSYTITAANTWEQKSITVAGDTTGTWRTTTAAGLTVGFSLGTGSTLSGTAGAWAGSNFLSATGATSVVGTSGATFYITGVQLEEGSVATEFDRLPYGTQLALCQRYYWKSWVGGSTPSGAILATSGMQGIITTGMINGSFIIPVEMRATPTSNVWDAIGSAGLVTRYNPNSANNHGQSGEAGSLTAKSFFINSTSGANASQVAAYVQLTAEL